MPASPIDSALYGELFGDGEVAALFTDSAELRAMLIVEGALAKVQGEMGIIPELSGAHIHRASFEAQLDPAALAAETGRNAVPVPAVVAAFRKAMGAPEHAQYLHWGATSQDIMDTGLVLRLRRLVDLLDGRLGEVLDGLAAQAEAHADLPMAARTYLQAATPTSFGAVTANWGAPLIRYRDRLGELRKRMLAVSLAGGSGTLAVMDGHGPELRARLAEALDLADPGGAWHSTRDRVAELSGWLAGVAVSLGKLGEDLTLMSQSGIGEVQLAAGGGSSTMPQKQNPVQPSLLVALARQAVALDSAIQGAGLHRQQRDGAAWFVEWMSLPQLCIATARGLAVAANLARTMAPVPERMQAGLEGDGLGLIHAEALSFALTAMITRVEAQAAVKAMCQEARESGTPLPDLAESRWPGQSWASRLTPQSQMGEAPAEARAFARRARGA